MESPGYNWDAGAWKLLKLIMNEPKYLVQHQIDSYNYFLDYGLKAVIEQFNTIILNYDFVENQQFYRIKASSEFYDCKKPDWIEYSEITDIYTLYKDNYEKLPTEARIIDLIEQPSIEELRKKKLQKQFGLFLDTHIEFKVL